MNLLMTQMEPNKKLVFSQTYTITIMKIKTILKFCSPLPLDIAIKGPTIPKAEPAQNFAKNIQLSGPAMIKNVQFFLLY